MDQNARLAKVEAFVETFREDLDRLHAADERLADEIAQLREHMDRALADLRQYMDLGLAESRQHTDQGLAELRQHTDRGLEQLRKEFNTTARWLIGLMLANTSMTLGLIARSAGWF